MPYIKASSTQTLIVIMLWSQQLHSKIYMQLIMIQLSDQFLSQNQYHLIIFIKKAVSLLSLHHLPLLLRQLDWSMVCLLVVTFRLNLKGLIIMSATTLQTIIVAEPPVKHKSFLVFETYQKLQPIRLSRSSLKERISHLLLTPKNSSIYSNYSATTICLKFTI